MVVETNTKYLSEIKQGEEIDIHMTYFDHDKKRLHIKMDMIEKSKKKISATIEWISLYIDLSQRKVTEFEEDKLKLMDKFIKDNKIKFSSKDLLFSSKLKK